MIMIISGMSGAGKTQAIKIFEDLNFFCVDNIPPRFIVPFIDLCFQTSDEIENVAVVTNVWGGKFSGGEEIPLIDYKTFRDDVKLIFLDARDEVLISRYQETRRNHPLTHTADNLLEAIRLERKNLKRFEGGADVVIDTSDLEIRELKDKLIKIVDNTGIKKGAAQEVKIYSFGFKYDSPLGADFVFDVRFLPNPFYKEELRHKSGEDPVVRDYVMSFQEARFFFDQLVEMMLFVIPKFSKVSKNTVEIAIGCTGGQHRSVTFAFLLNAALKECGFETKLKHRDVNRSQLDTRIKYDLERMT